MKYLLLLPFFSFTQLTIDSNAIRFAEEIDTADINKHVFTLASDAYEGRWTGSKGQKMTAAYLAGKFNSFGIPPYNQSYFQKYTIIQEKDKKMALSIGDSTYAVFEDFYPVYHIKNKQVNFNKAVYAGYGIKTEGYDDYEGLSLKGKVVFIHQGEPIKKGKYWISGTDEESEFGKKLRTKVTIAKDAGAKAVFIILNDFPKPSDYQWNHFYQPTVTLKSKYLATTSIPIICISKRIAKQVFQSEDIFKRKRKINRRFKPQSFEMSIPKSIFSSSIHQEESTAENVIGYIEGTSQKDQVIIISAHYDHIGIKKDSIFYGADDNASGTAALIEIAEAFQKAKEAGFGPKKSILILPFSGEENGLLGSNYYSNNPLIPLENTVANLNVDMIGRVDNKHKNDSNYIYLIGSDFISQDLHNLSEEVNQTYLNINLDYTYNSKDDPNKYYYRSDHYHFAKNGIPVIFYFNGIHKDYHRPSDTADKILVDLIKRRTDLIFYTAWELAK